MLFLKDISEQDEKSITKVYFFIQHKSQTKGDLVRTMLKDLKALDINLSFSQIEEMNMRTFKNMINNRVTEKCLSYLTKMRRKKGLNNVYKSIQMSDYLMPNQYIQNINDKRMLFSLKNDMYLCHENGYIEKECLCKRSKENLSHLYSCEFYNEKQHMIPFYKIYNGSLYEQCEILKIMKSVFEKRNNNMTMKYNIKETNVQS